MKNYKIYRHSDGHIKAIYIDWMYLKHADGSTNFKSMAYIGRTLPSYSLSILRAIRYILLLIHILTTLYFIVYLLITGQLLSQYIFAYWLIIGGPPISYFIFVLWKVKTNHLKEINLFKKGYTFVSFQQAPTSELAICYYTQHNP